ncbi:type II toxin-antitoxin system RelE/ParE family toxin [Roseisolibacter agri]|uniref:Toxin, RelE family protein n=1 Tax=Roseisolibacter agri TaxID=2014610 RepID=A0AA37V0J9_9BACT|nr:type II toxin-antitoxin system RelE/ParE family toxin [Roseisolibacter agri]GLC24640.1 toxin, RelE family protein [Roseisolibacter agri]
MPPVAVLWSAQAADDLQEIHDYIARQSPRYAAVVAGRLVAAVDRVREFPESGRIVPELNDPAVREVIHGAYRIVYELQPDVAVVLTVFRASRAFPLD